MPRERWTFTFELTPEVGNDGRFVARILKWLSRTWRVRCVALREPPPDEAPHALAAEELR